MILLAFAASAAELLQESAVSTGVDASMTLTVDDQRAMLVIQNLGTTPFVIDWEHSTITPIGGEPDNLVPGGPDRPEAGVLVAPLELPAGESFRLRPIPRGWIEDGVENDAAQWASWEATGTVTIALAILTADGEASVQASWRQAESAALALALPVEPVVPGLQPVTPNAEAQHALQLQRVEWGRRYNSYRRQEAIARVLWISGASIGVIGGLSALSAGTAAVDAPEVAAEGQNSQAELIRAARFYGIASGVGFAIAIPSGIWDFGTRKRRRNLGPRP